MDAYLSAVQRALDHIEAHLREPLHLEAIARRAGFSLWHFQRIFAAFVGEPLGSYVRRRRLTVAATELRASSRRILDIALDHQFESHEAFTRAFRSVFKITPSDFRRKPHLIWANSRPRLDSSRLRQLALNPAMNPSIITLPAFTLLGLETRFISAMSPDANNLEMIPPLFGQLFSRKADLTPALDQFTYGACRCLPDDQRTREDECVYLAGIHVAADAPVPAGMTTWQVPALTYAHFTHRGPVTHLKETINHAYGTWLPRSDYECTDGPELERYDDRFAGGNSENSVMDFLLPIKRKPAN